MTLRYAFCVSLVWKAGRRVPWGLWCAALGVIPARGGSALGKQGQALHLEGPLCVRLSEV